MYYGVIIKFMKHWITLHWLKVVAIAMLSAVLYAAVMYADGGNPLPVAFYQLLNWVVVGASIVTAQHASDKNKMFITWVFVILAVVFNPIAPLSMRQDVWQVADIIAILLFVYALIPKRK